jgi:hypothetical protein
MKTTKLNFLTCKIKNGYCCSCDKLNGFVVAGEGSFEEFKKYVKESIDSRIESYMLDHNGDAPPYFPYTMGFIIRQF